MELYDLCHAIYILCGSLYVLLQWHDTLSWIIKAVSLTEGDCSRENPTLWWIHKTSAFCICVLSECWCFT